MKQSALAQRKIPRGTAFRFFLRGDEYARSVSVSYADLLAGIRRTANLLHSIGVEPNDVISLILPNLPQTQFALWGAEATGIANPINSFLEANAICDIMRAAGTKVLITLGPVEGSDIWPKVSKILDDIPTLKTVLQVMGTTDANRNILSFDEAIRGANPARLQSGRQIRSSDAAAMFHTGGTTGRPKLALHTHGNQVYSAWVTSIVQDFRPSDILLAGLPLFHVTGAIVTSLMPYLAGGTTVFASAQGYRDPSVIRNIYKIFEAHRITFFVAVPTLYAALLQVPREGEDISSVKQAKCGTAPMPLELFRAFEQRTGIPVCEAYGLTEGTCVTASNPAHGERRVGSVGLRLPYEEMKAVRLDANGKYERDCAAGEIGVILLRGPNVFAGYKEERHSRDACIDDGSGKPWLNTGDTGRQDAEGYFWLTGRIKELIIRGGHNIDPASIEGPLTEHPAVALAAAIGRPDPYAGEVPIAYVTLKAGASATPEELIAYARQTFGERAAMPKAIKIIDRMPLTAVGKLFKPQLRWWSIAEAYREALKAIGEQAEIVDVEVGPDDVHGTLARITLKPNSTSDCAKIEEVVAEILGNYTMRYQLQFATDSSSAEAPQFRQ